MRSALRRLVAFVGCSLVLLPTAAPPWLRFAFVSDNAGGYGFMRTAVGANW